MFIRDVEIREIYSRSICNARLKRSLQFLTSLLHFRCDQTSPSYVQAYPCSLFARYVANRRRDCRRRQDILERGNEINGARTIRMHGTTAKFRDSVMRWEPFEARLCAPSVSAASHAGSFVAPLSMSYDDANVANYIRMYALRISVLSQ